MLANLLLPDTSTRSALFSSLLSDLIALQRRGMELQDFYKQKLEAEEHYEVYYAYDISY